MTAARIEDLVQDFIDDPRSVDFVQIEDILLRAGYVITQESVDGDSVLLRNPKTGTRWTFRRSWRYLDPALVVRIAETVLREIDTQRSP